MRSAEFLHRREGNTCQGAKASQDGGCRGGRISLKKISMTDSIHEQITVNKM